VLELKGITDLNQNGYGLKLELLAKPTPTTDDSAGKDKDAVRASHHRKSYETSKTQAEDGGVERARRRRKPTMRHDPRRKRPKSMDSR